MHLLGPVRRVSATAFGASVERTSTDPTDQGRPFIPPQASTVAGALEFANGVVATLLASADANRYQIGGVIHGTVGALEMADPNYYGGECAVVTPKARTVQSSSGFAERGRGLGLADMATALRTGQMPRCSGQRMYHVLDVLLALHEAAERGRAVEIKSTP